MATLILKEIPVSGYSYVLVRSVWKDNLPGLLAEAAAFCREAGAKEVFASYECYDLPARHVHDVLEFTMDPRRLPEVAPVPPDAHFPGERPGLSRGLQTAALPGCPATPPMMKRIYRGSWSRAGHFSSTAAVPPRRRGGAGRK